MYSYIDYILQFELTNLFAKILNQRQNIHEKEEQGDDEKGKLVSLGQMNSLSVSFLLSPL